MKILVVGGAVRDMELGKVVNDIDYLVQGATKEEFMREFPTAVEVGNHFPVYLVDGEEYAFARTERSTGNKHTEFSVVAESSISIIEDLERRDLTINSIALCAETGELVASDQALLDLTNRIIRHNNGSFKEDPLRVFRVARFAAQLHEYGFVVAPETLEYMKSMAMTVMCLPPERIFKELEKALESEAPRKFFDTLKDCNCLAFWFPHIYNLIGVPAGPQIGKHKGELDTYDHTMICLERMPSNAGALRYAVLCHDIGKALSPAPPKHAGHDYKGVPLVESMSDSLRVPRKWKQAAVLFTEQHLRMHKIEELRAGKAVSLLTMIHSHRIAGGLVGFLHCSMGDGMNYEQVMRIIARAHEVFDVVLPKKYHGRGKVCGEVLHQLRCEAWKRSK